MYKEHLLQNIEREIHLLKRLAPMIQEKDLNFRTADNVRTTHELMAYLSGIGNVMFRWMLQENFTPEERKKLAEYRNSVTIENFVARLDEQLAQIREHLKGISDEDLMKKKVFLPWKEEMVLGAAIINAPIKWLTTYRMELFRNLKLNGRPELSTKHAWDPADPEPVV